MSKWNVISQIGSCCFFFTLLISFISFFFNFILFLNFTILYWFCQITLEVLNQVKLNCDDRCQNGGCLRQSGDCKGLWGRLPLSGIVSHLNKEKQVRLNAVSTKMCRAHGGDLREPLGLTGERWWGIDKVGDVHDEKPTKMGSWIQAQDMEAQKCHWQSHSH